MPDYSKGKIYKVYSDEVNSQVYYGSTTRELLTRMTAHRCDYRSYLKGEGGYCYCYVLFDKYGLEKCKIELIENYPCNDKSTLLKREGEFIRCNECVNKNIAGRTPEQYRQDMNEQQREYGRKYYQNNREKCLENGKKWRENNPEYNKKYRQDNKERERERVKKWSQDNREHIRKYYQDNRERSRKYYQDNKEKCLENGKKYYQDNREKERQRKKIYYQNNREKERERCKKWRENNPEYYKKKQLNITDT